MQTTCPPCRDEFPVMNGFAVRYAATGLVVLAVDIREDPATVAGFHDALHATFPIGLDADGVAQRAWGALALPIHLWVDREGIIRAGALGGLGPDAMARDLATILPGITVTP
jgi:thiol-disulfide isomerase/thioredoxin